MSVKINKSICTGCGLCIRICPGDLLFRDVDGKAEIYDARNCWDCASCVKECPKQAIEMYLPVQIGGRGSTLKARKYKNKTVWELKKPDGKIEIFEIESQKII